MIEFRIFDFKRDVKEVVLIIQKNLNGRYSEELFLWKHRNNPFGESKGGVAVRNGNIVGVLFYMQYNFESASKGTLKGLRPVDGCTDMEVRGQGVFKKLMNFTLELYNNDYEILIASPNPFSRPELLKLGWKPKKGICEFRIGFIIPNTSKFIEKFHNHTFEDCPYYDEWTTANSLRFLKWRYSKGNYKLKEFYIKGKGNFIAYRLNKIRGIKYIILCDFFGEKEFLNIIIKSLCKQEKCFMVYYFPNKITNEINFVYNKKLKDTVILFKENNFRIDNNFILSCGDVEGII